MRVLDNFSTGKHENIPKGAELFHGDMRHLEEIRPAFEGIDGVFHLAAMPRVPYSIQFPIETNENNVTGTLNVFVAARDAKVKRVVYSASSSAYGNQPRAPYTPDMKPNPLNPYAIQKYVGELYATQFFKLFNLPTVSLRYFNVYGPRMANEGAYVTVIAIFMRQKKAGEPLTIDGDGSQARDFTHVHDVARANYLAMTSEKAGHGEVINIGGGEKPHSVKDIADIIGGPVAYREPRKGDPALTWADLTLTKELIGWEPQIKFGEGLRTLLRENGIEPAS